MVMRYSEGNMKSANEQAKIDSERVERANELNDSSESKGIGTIDFSDGSGCGLENTCDFGKHSKL